MKSSKPVMPYLCRTLPPMMRVRQACGGESFRSRRRVTVFGTAGTQLNP